MAFTLGDARPEMTRHRDGVLAAAPCRPPCRPCRDIVEIRHVAHDGEIGATQQAVAKSAKASLAAQSLSMNNCVLGILNLL